MPPNPTCSALAASGQKCTKPATREIFCYWHDPKVIQARENRLQQEFLDRKARREQLDRKLALVPILAQAREVRKRVQDDQRRQGCSIIIKLLEDAIRGEEE